MDAHGDSNTPDTTPSGNVHGMPFAVALGLADDPFPDALRGTTDGKNGVLLAIRDIDPGEKANIRRAGVTPITMSDVDRIGMARAMEQAIGVASKGDGIHLSLDMDAIDPDEAPGVGTPVRAHRERAGTDDPLGHHDRTAADRGERAVGRGDEPGLDDAQAQTRPEALRQHHHVSGQSGTADKELRSVEHDGAARRYVVDEDVGYQSARRSGDRSPWHRARRVPEREAAELIRRRF